VHKEKKPEEDAKRSPEKKSKSLEDKDLEFKGENHDLQDDSSSVSSEDSPVSSRGGGIYSAELLETFGLNIHRIDKDVKRCDRNYWYFTESNLDKLRNVMCT
jgi:hypothetical protein